MTHLDLIAGLLADLNTLTRVSEAGLLSRREVRLEPGETRPAAILFLDLVGFTDLSRVLTSQQLTLLIDRTFQIFELTVRSHGGYWDARFGDASLYVFPGHPNYAPACEGALLASMALLERARLIERSLADSGLQLNVRIGVAFGEVTRQRVGGGDRQLTVMGDTVNLAQRLEASAEPGTVQTTLRVLDQAGESMVAQYRGDVVLKGFGTVQVQQLTAVRPKTLRLRSTSRDLAPLTGRDTELAAGLAQLEHWLDANPEADSTDSPNKLLLISGPPAVGKSRFAWELARRLGKQRSVAFATAHLTELGSMLGFAAELLQVGGLGSDNYAARWEELCQLAEARRGAEYADAARSHLPTLALILGAAQDAAVLSSLDPQSLLTSVAKALLCCLELVEAEDSEGERALLLIVEDVQWLGGLHRLLSVLLQDTQLRLPLVLLATTRERGLPPSLAGLSVARDEIALTPLSREAGAALFSALLPGLELPPQIEAELHEKSAGLPYYYEEFARMLVRRGIAVAQQWGEHYRLSQPLTELDLPEDVQMLVLGHLDQLEPRLRELTGRASVLGRSFNAALLRRVEDRLGLSSHVELDSMLDELVEQQILAVEPGERYFFVHALTREAAYGALLSGNRRALHVCVAQVLGDQLVPGSAAEADILPELADHLMRAGLAVEAHLRACQLLGLQAAAGSFEHWQQWEVFARASWAQAAAADPQLPNDSQAMLAARAARFVTQGHWDEALPCFEEALKLAREAGEPSGEAALLCSLGGLRRVRGEYSEAEGCYLKALMLARDSALPRLEAVALRELGTLQRERGASHEALDYLLRALDKARDCGDKRGEAVVLDSLGMVYMDRFMSEASADAFRQALALAAELRSPWTEGRVLGNLGLLHMKYTRFREAREALDRALKLAREVGDPRLEGEVASRHANLLLRLGDLADAEPDLARAAELLAQVGDVFQLGFVHCQWVFLHLNRGEAERARRALTEARMLSRPLKLDGESALAREIARAESAYEQHAASRPVA